MEKVHHWASGDPPGLLPMERPGQYITSSSPASPSLKASGHLEGRGFNGSNWVIVGGESGPKARPMHAD